MIETRDLEEFVEQNDRDIRRYLRSRGIWDREELNDIVQDFYYRCKDESLLGKFDPVRGPYSSYIFVLISTCISHYYKKAKPVHELPAPETTDVWGRVREFKDWIMDQPHSPQLMNELNRRIEGRTDRTCANTILFCQAIKIYQSLDTCMGVTGFQGAF